MKSDLLRAYILPGLVFQSVVIAGGYGTGRELAEFFLLHGPIEGLLGMLLISTLLWSLVCAATFEFARAFKAYDYRRFFKHLLGRGWILFEICYLILLLLVLAVIASAAGSILQETFGLPYLAGVAGIMLAVGFLVFKGSSAIEGFLSVWSLVLYLMYASFLAACFWYFGDHIRQAFQTTPQGTEWIIGGVKYAAYNLGVIPAVLFVIRHLKTRRQAIGAGLLAGPIAMMPGLFFYLAMASQYPQVLQRPVPANALLEALGSPLFQIAFQVVLFGTLIETGSGMIHAVNERVSNLMQERRRELPSWQRFALGVGLLLMGAIIAQYGLIGLIAQGYGTITWGFLLIYVIPILTWGMIKLRRMRS
ncbi:MAG TPA: hypothetical protein VLU25_18245 [Acidobacteriota bacterium]|nr:hypothetical protein [Acidobacteriota bacterium]